MKKIFCFGIGYSALAILQSLQKQQWMVSGTVKSYEKAQYLKSLGVDCQQFENKHWIAEKLAESSHILCSIPPSENLDPTLELYQELIVKASPQWIGYLSSTVVYGNQQGAWVSEDSSCSPSTKRGIARLQSEKNWKNLSKLNQNISVDIFRLAGIYGPYRNALSSLKNQKAQKIFKEGQVFGRIHRDDITSIVINALQKRLNLVYNCSDDLPSPPWEVIEYAEKLLKLKPLPLVPIEQTQLSPMAASFYQDNKRVNNQKIKKLLNITLKYPSYKEGLQSLFVNKEY